jgi:hypothetical protein
MEPSPFGSLAFSPVLSVLVFVALQYSWIWRFSYLTQGMRDMHNHMGNLLPIKALSGNLTNSS